MGTFEEHSLNFLQQDEQHKQHEQHETTKQLFF